MTLLRRSLSVAATLLAVLVVAAVALLAFALATTPGARWMVGLLGERLTGLSAGRVTGTLLTGVSITDVRYESDAASAELALLVVEPSWSAIVRGELVLRRLEAHGGTVALRSPPAPPAAGPSTAPVLPQIPDRVAVRAVRVTDLAVDVLGTALDVAAANAALDGPRLTLESLRLGIGELAIDGSADVVVAREGARGAFTAAMTPRRGEPAWQMDVDAEAVLQTAAEPWFVELTWRRLAWRGGPIGELSSAEGRVTATPGVAPLALTLAARIEGEELPETIDVTADATFAAPSLDLHELKVAAFGGELTARGVIDVDKPTGTLDIAVRGMDPARLDARLAGSLGADVHVELASEPALRVEADALVDGELNGHRLDGGASGRLADRTLELTRGELQLDEGRLEVVGTVARDATQLRVAAQIPDVSAWYPRAGGTIGGTGSVNGPLRDLAVQARVEGSGLSLEGIAIPALDTFALDVNGTRAAHTLGVAATSPAGTLRAEVEQGWDGAALRGTLRNATLAVARAGTWTLTAPAEYSTGAGAVLAPACFVGPGDNRLCAKLGDRQLAVDARGLPSQLAQAWLPPGVELAGAADVDLDLDLRAQPQGSFVLKQRSLTIGASGSGLRDAEGTPLKAEIVDLEVRATLDGERVQASLGAAFPGSNDRIDGQLELTPARTDGELAGSFIARVTNLAVLAVLVPELADVSGAAAVEVHVAGTPAAPQVDATLRVESFAATLPALGVQVTNAGLRAEGLGWHDSALEFDGELCTVGCATFNGRVQRAPERGWRLNARLAGERIQVADLPNLRAVVAPDLDLVATADEWRVTGGVDVLEAAVVVAEQSRAAVRPAPETIVHGREADDDTQALPAALVFDVRARLGNVNFEGLGVTADLEGALELERSARGALLVRGTTSVARGTFRAYLQELTIERGLLIFTGPPDDPTLDIRAVRTAEGVRVGLAITGTANNPRSEVFADEAMSESEALARLVTGRSLASASGTDTAALERAALGAGLTRMLPSLDRLGSNIGLELEVHGGFEDSDGVLVAGRQFGNDVLLRYKHGLFDDFAGLELIYRVTEGLRLHTEAGTAQSIDLIYEVDPNKVRALRDLAGSRLRPSGADAAPPGSSR